MRLIFIRHAEPDYSIDSLTPKGWQEAAALTPRVARWEVAAFYRSPLGRAGDTARVAMADTGRSPETLEWLREFPADIEDPETGRRRIPWDLKPGDWTAEPLLYDRERWYDAPLMTTGPVKETYLRICGELDGFLARHGYVREGGYYRPERPNGDTLVFFCHLGIIGALLGHLFGVSPSVLWQAMFLPPSSVTVLATEERRPGEAYFRLQTAGDTRHLSDAGLPISSSGYYAPVFQG